MASPLRLALFQQNPTVGDIAANEAAIAAAIARAREAGAGLVVCGELAVTGYPPEDLLYKEHFLRDARAAVERLAALTADGGPVAVVGFPDRGADVHNAAAVIAEGRVAAVYHKVHLQNYGVFDEQRYFRAGTAGGVIALGERRIGVTVCEDIWQPGPPSSDEALAGASLIVNLSASPYHAGKGLERETMVIQRARENVAAFAFCAIVGGQDELVFDGHSFVVDHDGTLIARAAQFEEELLVCDVDLDAAAAERLRSSGLRSLARNHTPNTTVLATLPAAPAPPGPPPAPRIAPLIEPRAAEIYAALVLGLRDYVEKNGFGDVVVSVSGGIDSAVTAALAVEALGPERVHTVSMPSRYSSQATRDDARRLAENLGCDFRELGIEPVVDAATGVLAESFAGREPDLAEENLQARVRGTLLMALSNKFGWLVIATGTKSELSVGYATLYGDMAGGFALLKDVYKTDVWRLSRYLNERARREVIPASIIERAPSAELRDDQLDEDSLPPYPELDKVLEAYVEEDRSRDELTSDGFDPDVVERALALIDRAEYKRRQAPPGVKLRPKAFGRDRRTPITNRWRD